MFEFFWQPLGGNQFFGFSMAIAVLAGVHVFYGFVVFRFLIKKNEQLAGLISLFLFIILSAVLIHTSRETGTQYVGLWTVATIISGLFGLLTLVAVTLASILYTGLIIGSIITAPNEYDLSIILIQLVTAGVSYVLWRNISLTSPSDSDQASIDEAGSIKNAISTEVIIGSIADGVLITDDKGIIRVFNKPAANITGWPSQEALGLDYKSVFKLVDNENKEVADADNPIQTVLKTAGTISNSNLQLFTKSKNTSELDIVASPLKSRENVIIGSLVIFRDISKRRSEERQRAEFISTASHEMRTPVAAIEGYLALALNEKVAKIDSSARGYLEKAHTSTQHLGKLFQDLLTAAKSEDGRLTNHPVAVEVGSFLDEIIEGVRFTAEKKGLLLEGDFGNGKTDATKPTNNIVRPVAYAHVDPERIREVVVNLFDNATKYTAEGKITIGMRITDSKVKISVSDTGHGIPKEDIPHLFQKFYRVDNSATRQIGGTGLGLFICRKIVELYGGRIWVESELNEGSTFFIELPRISAEQAQAIQAKEAAAESPLDKPTPATQQPAINTETPAAPATQPDPAPPVANAAPTPVAADQAGNANPAQKGV